MSDRTPKKPMGWGWPRTTLALAGLATLAFGAEQLLTGGNGTRLTSSVPWLVAVLVVHDGVLAPLAAVAGWALTRLLSRGRAPAALPVVAGGVFVAAVLTLLALPALLAPGLSDNPSALPRNYAHGLLALLALDVAATGALAVASVLRTRRRTVA